MLYEYDVVVPPNTLKSAPVVMSVPFTAGRITAMHVQFPAGCAGLVHTTVSDELHQIAPANQDGDIKADGAIIDFPDDVAIPVDNFELQVRAWNDDDSFTHTITWRFAVQTAVDAQQQQSALNALLYLDQWFSSQGGVNTGVH